MLDLSNFKTRDGILLISLVAFLLALFAFPFASRGPLSLYFYEVLFDAKGSIERDLSWLVGIGCVCYLIAAIFTAAKVFGKRFRAQLTISVIAAIASVVVMVVAHVVLDDIKSSSASFGVSWWFFYAAAIILIVETVWPKLLAKKYDVEEDK